MIRLRLSDERPVLSKDDNPFLLDGPAPSRRPTFIRAGGIIIAMNV
ncbi:hypothetical protein L2449_22840 [Mesorhizobium muleiense]|nr:hypothetical protein [Mesorhizobium muleiense]MCF6119679.1 hypothetical protein [Mesorhizobium muleiense]